MAPVTSRFYKQKYPEVDEVVMVNVKAIDQEMGAYVELLEYNNIEGMILLSELSRRRIRSINRLIRVGKNECVQVIRVDKEKGYIDLSKRRVAPEEIVACEEQFARAKAVNSMVRHTVEVLNIEDPEDINEFFEKTVWHFDTKTKSKSGSYDIFKLCISNPALLNECEISDNAREVLLGNIRRRLTPQPVKCRADIEIASYGFEGIDAIKASLKAGLELSTKDNPIKISLIAPPLFVVTLVALDRKQGIDYLNAVLEAIRKTISEKYKGIFRIVLEPKVVTDNDDTDLRRRLEEAEAELREVPGDDDDRDDTSDEDSLSDAGGGGGDDNDLSTKDEIVNGAVDA